MDIQRNSIDSNHGGPSHIEGANSSDRRMANVPLVAHRSLSETVYDARRRHNRFNFMSPLTRSIASGSHWVVSHVPTRGSANAGTPHEAAALADNGAGLAALTKPQVAKMIKELRADVRNAGAGSPQFNTALQRVQNLVAALPDMATNIPSHKEAYKLITDVLHKLNKNNPAEMNAGQQIMQSLFTMLHEHFIAHDPRPPANGEFGVSHNSASADPATRAKWSNQKQVVKLIVRNAPDFFDAGDCQRQICGLIQEELHASSGSRQHDGWGTFGRELGKHLHRYPVNVRMNIAEDVMKNLARFPNKVPAGHVRREKLSEKVMVGLNVTGWGAAFGGMVTMVTAAALMPPLFIVAGVTCGAGLAANIAPSVYNKVRTQFKETIREQAFANVVLGALHNDPKRPESEQITPEQSVELFVKLRNHAGRSTDANLSPFKDGLEEIFDALHVDVKTLIEDLQADAQ